MVPGSIAVFSNSGNFTTTMATYLLTEGWGTTISFSSGKDLYIHFSAAEFTHAFHNDDRSKAALMYIEPGGYYEYDLEFSKPVVACIVGRWKDKLTRACGHAGAIAGAGDKASSKEGWFMEKLDVDGIYTPENPICTKKGAVVTNIAHIPEALTRVMELNGIQPDFAPQGDLSLKCWFANDQGIELPKELQLPVVEAIAPYNEQVAVLSNQIGTVFPRQTLKDTSGASMMDPKTQVSQLNGVSVLDTAIHSFEDNLVMSVVRQYPDDNGRKLANVALHAYINQHGTPMLAAADAAREAGNSPNTVFASSMAILGPGYVKAAREASQALVKLFKKSGLSDPGVSGFDLSNPLDAALTDPELRDALISKDPDARGSAMIAAVGARGADSVFIRFLEALEQQTEGHISADAMLAAICCHLAWGALLRKRLSMNTLNNMPWHFRVFSTLVGVTPAAAQQEADHFVSVSNQELMDKWSFGETAHLALLGKRPSEGELFALSVLLGLTVTNGPGTISAQGCKGAVSADGPEVPDRVQINKAYVGFLSHAGYAHGGNGFEAMAFLIDRFRTQTLANPGNAAHGLDLTEMTAQYAKEYLAYKSKAKAEGNLSYAKIPCINHPIFKGKDVNFDPREVFVSKLLKERGSYNIFHEFYHELVLSLAKYGVSRNVYCVNIDAVIAVILLKMLWEPFVSGEISEQSMESAAFTTFVYGRMAGDAAEIEDHTNRGRNMDTRTAASKCSYIN
ncbi:MAG: CoA-binding protein [Gammaproteobacteria bacterium]|nr:CoA-binding protein [Gammaproteobacteria bacterium]